MLGQATGTLTHLTHHLLPYSILYSSPRRLHPNGSFSRDSQGRVLKLSQVGVLGLWELISPDCKIWLERGLNQSCSSPRELFNAMSHSFCRRQEEVDSWLLVVGSQTANLTPDLSFPITWVVYFQMAHARPFWTSTLQDLSNDIKNTQMRGDLTPAIELWILGIPKDSIFSLSGVWVSSSHLSQSGVATVFVNVKFIGFVNCELSVIGTLHSKWFH